MNECIEIKNLNVYYDNICALEDINLTIFQGDFLGIIGPNGGGKSTLLKTILGLVPSYSGTVKVLGKPPHKADSSMGYVPQFSKAYNKFPINVQEVVLMGRLCHKNKIFTKFSQEDRKITESIMEDLHISHLQKRQISQLSGGQLQRVMIARALAIRPRLLLLDEPTASLDTESKDRIYSLLHELNKSMTIILVTHDLTAISSYVKNIACLNKKLHYHGEPELNNTVIKKVFGCPVDLLAHGVPHRVLEEHKEVKHA